jgi:hypothetical protein
VVKCVAFDGFVQGASLPQAIKYDIEGAEVEVLRGATNLLAESRSWILCGMCSEANDSACRKILQGYRYFVEAIDSNDILATPSET